MGEVWEDSNTGRFCWNLETAGNANRPKCHWPVVIEWFASVWTPFGMLYIYKIFNAFTDLGNSVTVQ